jgi:hypothetical protein
MVYTKFTPDTPIITDTGAEVIDDTRNNLMALRDAIVAGALVDWWMTPSGGTAEEPAQIIYGARPVVRTGRRQQLSMRMRPTTQPLLVGGTQSERQP